jgi:type III pantothenate kinase
MLFDAGNSRIKWALVRDGRLGALQAAALDDITALQRWLARTAQIDRAVGVCVAGKAYERLLKVELHRVGHPAPEFVKSSDLAGGVRNGYREAWQLGDDRWAGAVAAWHRAGCYRTVCAVSVGTALTIDLVDHDGHHRGGLIAPGPEMMLGSLLGKTKGIAERAAPGGARPRRKPAAGLRGVVRPLAPPGGGRVEACEERHAVHAVSVSTSPAGAELSWRVRDRRRCSSGVTTSAGGTHVKCFDTSFRSTKASVPKTKGSVRAGSPQGTKIEAIAPKSNAVNAAQATPNNAERQVST